MAEVRTRRNWIQQLFYYFILCIHNYSIPKLKLKCLVKILGIFIAFDILSGKRYRECITTATAIYHKYLLN